MSSNPYLVLGLKKCHTKQSQYSLQGSYFSCLDPFKKFQPNTYKRIDAGMKITEAIC